MNTKESFSFLEERPIEIEMSSSISFGHTEIIDTLKEIVKNSVHPFTIGLFGKWGTGKSTIAENLKRKLNEDLIPTIIFDVWKHEGDSLRRTFLMELVEQFNSIENKEIISTRIDLDERVFYGSSSITQKYKWNKKKLGYHIIVLLLFSACLIVPFLLIWFLVQTIFDYSIFKGINTGSILSTLLAIFSASYLYKYIEQFIEIDKTDTKRDKFQDPHEFEKEFLRVISICNSKRILIVFDNLDRVSGENAVRIISTIKTFLEPSKKVFSKNKELVFLIPCDVTAIKGHLLKVFKDETNKDDQNGYADEFLRKFFNSVLWIPEFYEVELELFAKKKLIQTKIPEFDNDYLAWLIIQVFKQNPRQIIQFINILISNYLLIKQNSEKDWLTANFYKDNIPQLAKYLLILQKFPSIVEKLKFHCRYNLQENSYNEDILKNDPSYQDFRRFLENTSQIKIESIQTFISYKISEYEKKLKGVTELIQELNQNKLSREKVIEIAKRLNLKENINEFSGIIKSSLRSKANPISATIFINNLFELTNYTNTTLTQTVYTDIENRLNENSWIQKSYNIDPELLEMEFYNKHQTHDPLKRKRLYEHQLGFIETKDNSMSEKVNEAYTYNVIKISIHNKKLLSSQTKVQLANLLMKMNPEDLKYAELVLTAENEEEFCNDNFVINFISKFSFEDFQEKTELNKRKVSLSKKITFLFRGTGVLNKVYETLNKLLSEILNKRVNNLGIEAMEKVLSNIKFFIVETKDLISNVQQNIIVNFMQILQNTYNQNRFNHSYLLIPSVLELKKINKEPSIGTCNHILNDFYNNLSNVPANGFVYIFRELKNKKEFFGLQYHSQILSYSVANKNFFLNQAIYAPEDFIEKNIANLLNNKSFAAIREFIQSNDYNLNDNFRDKIKMQLKNENEPTIIKAALELIQLIEGNSQKINELFEFGLRNKNSTIQITYLEEMNKSNLFNDSHKKNVLKDYVAWFEGQDTKLYKKTLQYTLENLLHLLTPKTKQKLMELIPKE